MKHNDVVEYLYTEGGSRFMDFEDMLEQTKDIKEESTPDKRARKMADRIRRKYKTIEQLKYEEQLKIREREERKAERERLRKEAKKAKMDAIYKERKRKRVLKEVLKYKRAHKEEIRAKFMERFRYLSIYVEKEIYFRLDEYVKEHNITKRSLIEAALTEYMDNHK